MLLLASCGQQYQAKQLVKEFVKANATEEVDITSFSDLDSTKVINDSLFQAMRKNATQDPLFKKGTQFTAERAGKTLLYIRMRYGADSLNQSRTFYFNPDLAGIVVYK